MAFAPYFGHYKSERGGFTYNVIGRMAAISAQEGAVEAQ